MGASPMVQMRLLNPQIRLLASPPSISGTQCPNHQKSQGSTIGQQANRQETLAHP
jgi:hypothetical protein